MRFFKNPDGTFNAINIFVFVFVLSFILLFLLCRNLIFEEKEESQVYTTTTTKQLEWKACEDCSVMFKLSSIEMQANSEEYLKNIVEVKNAVVGNVNYSSSDNSIVEIKNTTGDIALVAGNKIGKATITAKIGDSKAVLEVNVVTTKVEKAKFKNNYYYAYLGKKTKLDIETSPLNAPLKLLDLKSDNEEIGTFDEENNFIGKQVGETKVTLTQNKEMTTAVVNVIKNKITIKVKIDGKYQEMTQFEYPSNIDNYIELCIKFEDNDLVGYDQNSIITNVASVGKMNVTLSSEGPYTLDKNSYIFKAHIKLDQSVESTENYSNITFALPDGSKSTIKITKE